MAKKTKVLICGLGSIGQRHLRNLRSIFGDSLDVSAFRQARVGRLISNNPTDHTAQDIESAYNVTSYNDLDRALATNPSMVFITNPTALHMPIALAAASTGCHLLIEKPISHTLDQVETLRQLVRTQNLVAQVAFQFRFHPGLLQLKQWIEAGAIGQIVSVQAHWGEYLPNWHPWEDHRTGYAAREDLGGGVTLTLCHPFDYLLWLVGDVQRVHGQLGYNGGLGIEVEDTADVQLEFDNGALGHVHLNYVERPTRHTLHIVGQTGTLRWDASDGVASRFDIATNTWVSVAPAPDFERNTLFINELQHFLASVRGETEPICSLEEGIKSLKICVAVKQSAVSKESVEL